VKKVSTNSHFVPIWRSTDGLRRESFLMPLGHLSEYSAKTLI
jgi:hypothetical protein